MRAPFPKGNLAQWARELTEWLNNRLNELVPTFPLLGHSGDKGIAGLLGYAVSTGQAQVFDGSAWANTSRVPVYAFADLPAASAVPTGTLVFITDGANETGTGNMAVSDGTNWRRFDNGATAGT